MFAHKPIPSIKDEFKDVSPPMNHLASYAFGSAMHSNDSHLASLSNGLSRNRYRRLTHPIQPGGGRRNPSRRTSNSVSSQLLAVNRVQRQQRRRVSSNIQPQSNGVHSVHPQLHNGYHQPRRHKSSAHSTQFHPRAAAAIPVQSSLQSSDLNGNRRIPQIFDISHPNCGVFDATPHQEDPKYFEFPRIICPRSKSPTVIKQQVAVSAPVPPPTQYLSINENQNKAYDFTSFLNSSYLPMNAATSSSTTEHRNTSAVLPRQDFPFFPQESPLTQFYFNPESGNEMLSGSSPTVKLLVSDQIKPAVPLTEPLFPESFPQSSDDFGKSSVSLRVSFSLSPGFLSPVPPQSFSSWLFNP